MSISFKKYINITSGVAGGNAVATRQFGGRVFSSNPLIDPALVLTFGNPADVGTYFGITSHEYARAVKYFNYVSPDIRTPQVLQFARWCPTAAPASAYGADMAFTLATLKLITAGVIKFNFAGTSVEVVGVSFAAAAALADVASELQTALRLNADTHLTTCTVSYDAVNSRFIFIASPGTVTAGSFAMVQDGIAGTDIGAALGLYATLGALVLSSSPINTPVAAFIASVALTNNFGSFCFTHDTELTLLQIQAVAAQNATYNVMFMYHVKVTFTNAVAWSAALITDAGVGLTVELDTLTEYPEMIPMSIQGATDYTQRNGVVNYMYRQVSNTSPSVVDDTTAAALDAERINYYGQTQTAGQLVQFYQPGVLCGLATAPQAMNIFANEQWFKDYVGANLLSLQLAIGQLSANASGRGMVLTVLQGAITAALFNGTISVGKTLTPIQKLFITELTGDNLAWVKVQNSGYWLDCTITSSVDPVSSLTIYTANYTLIYGKNDSIRNIVGTHALI